MPPKPEPAAPTVRIKPEEKQDDLMRDVRQMPGFLRSMHLQMCDKAADQMDALLAALDAERKEHAIVKSFIAKNEGLLQAQDEAIAALTERLDADRKRADDVLREIAAAVRNVAVDKDAIIAAICEDRSECDKLREVCKELAIQPEYDCPGDTPQVVGHICILCDETNHSGTIEHKPECPLYGV